MVTGNTDDYKMTDAVRRDVDPRVFTTDPENHEEGLTFVWAMTRWYERVEGSAGVAFPPLEEEEGEIRGRLAARGLDLTEIDADEDYMRMVRDEFMEQGILYPEAPEDSDQDAGAEDGDVGADARTEGGTRF
jgi:hypothetical protein